VFFLGDAHRNWSDYKILLEKMDCSLQVGDMGIGFSDMTENSIGGKSYIRGISLDHKFIAGNHDNRKLCRSHKNYLGDYGYHEKSNIFYVSGGWSVDWKWRTKDHNWWADEQLSDEEVEKTLNLYKNIKPRVIVGHECPTEVKALVATNKEKMEFISSNEKLLQDMLNIHRPEYCIFGHHHNKVEHKQKGVLFVALRDILVMNKNEDCIYEISDIEW
jgi:hypothetical protein